MDNSKELIKKFYNRDEWDVCFGAMAILNLDYMKKLFDSTNYLEILTTEIKSRNDRMCFERSGLLLSNTIKTKAVNGDIHKSQKWGSSFSSYKNNSNNGNTMYKVWVGRKGN